MLTLLAAIRLPDFDPVAFRLGPREVRWYGLAYMAGFILAYYLLVRLAKRKQLRVDPPLVGDMVFWAAIGVLLGGRLGWWVFYHQPPAQPEPWYEPLAIWHGGMSFHGGLVGVILALYIWCRVRKVSFLNVADAAALVTPVGLFFGRLANFINAELVGRPTSAPWAVVYSPSIIPDGLARHPSQLYEAFLEGILLLALLWLVFKLFRLRDGTLMVLFFILYGVFRFLVEFTRTPDKGMENIGLGWMTMGQVLSAAQVVLGLIALAFLLRSRPAK